MKNYLNYQDKKNNKSSFLIFAFIVFSGASLIFASRTLANNAVLKSLFSCQAQGFGGVIPIIKISYQQGTNLSFIPTGEKIRKVWLNDPSQVTLDFDGPMCLQSDQGNRANLESCQNSGANVIHLRRIKKIDIPGLPNVSNTLLTVITQKGGQSKLYTFRVLYENIPKYHTLAIYPDPPNASKTPCANIPDYDFEHTPILLPDD